VGMYVLSVKQHGTKVEGQEKRIDVFNNAKREEGTNASEHRRVSREGGGDAAVGKKQEGSCEQAGKRG